MSISILHVSSVAKIGGAEHTLIELATNLDQTKYKSHLAVGEDGPLADRFRKMGFGVYQTKFPWFSRRRPWIYMQAIWQLCWLAKKQNASIIQVNCDRAVPHCVLAGRLINVPVVCYIHDMMRDWFLPAYVRWLNQCARIIADSYATAAHCVKSGMRPDKVQVIYESLDLERFLHSRAADGRELRTTWGISPETYVVGIVGQIVAHKGHREFVQSAIALTTQYANLHFVVVGDDALSADHGFMPCLKQMISDARRESQIRFVGFHDNVPSVMRALDLLAVPSWTEPFGRVIVEALAVGTPVIGTTAGGIPEIIRSEYNGLLVPPRDIVMLTQAIERLYLDESLRVRLSQNGPSSVLRFDVKAHAKQFSELYERLGRIHPESL